jgi:hypothetical protein
MSGMDSVRIGALAPLSRPGWLEAGRQLLAGLQLGARDVSAGGQPVELIVRDTGGGPERAAAAVDELAALGVAALAGEYHSVTARAVAARADALGLPFLCSSAVIDALTDGPTDWVARLPPPQSAGWSVFAEHLRAAGHRRVAVAAEPSVYWSAGTRILREHFDEVHVLAPAEVGDRLAGIGATALVLLAGHPEPATTLVRTVRGDPRLAGVMIGAPAGQPELADWGELGAGIPFLRYLPDRLTPLGERVEAALRGRPSFVAFEGYDTIVALTERLRRRGWADVHVHGTRGEIGFTRGRVWQWADAPIQVAVRDPADPDRILPAPR